MPQIEWNDIQNIPQTLRPGRQTVQIAGVRRHLNDVGTRCVEFTLQNDGGGRRKWSFSLEQEDRRYITNFLRDFLGFSYDQVMRNGGFGGLVGTEFEVNVEYLGKDSLTIMPADWCE